MSTIPAESTLPAIELLRLLVGDRIRPGTTEADAFFTDDELNLVLETGGGEIYWAASIAWGMKAAEYSRLIDMDESGSTRKLSQRYAQAEQMWLHYRDVAQVQQNYTPAVGRSANIYGVPGGRPDAPVTYIVWNAQTAFQPGTLVVYGNNQAFNCIAAVGPTATPPPSDSAHWVPAPLLPTNLPLDDRGIVFADGGTFRFVPNYG